MDCRTFGRTGLLASVAGLGCGGHSRLGLARHGGDDNAVAVIRRALDRGINFIDTAEAYGTEAVVGRALGAAFASGTLRRENVIVSTKLSPNRDGARRTAADFVAAADGCLRRLQTDYVDILHLHGVRADEYAFCQSELVPALFALRDAGKIRFLGITEAFGPDPGHAMLTEGALHDDCWDVMMVGFNLLNPSARERVFPITDAKNVGVLDMFAVRRALHDTETLRAVIDNLVAEGKLRAEDFAAADNPLDFLTANNVAATIPDAAYRFCLHEPGVHVVLFGTGSVAHVDENADSLGRPPLPPGVLERLRELFGGIDSVSGN